MICICVKNHSDEYSLVYLGSIHTWAWGKKLNNWNIYVVRDGEIKLVNLY